ncbi:PAS fold family [Coleofasciculus chthonoplastes PCC 7420]|uniref:PAS fold family n=1 Tax=Coleofasciculus chthonoplastes PCC 7420 TaxID=118168 RepID=B4VTQ5_9CYAN|nr:PAS domain S-box protein [Coleofasciculus chthonoplastes]EDX74773.1 PAS fold family [Coleofasciculus chthonoplastes PCC 7420]
MSAIDYHPLTVTPDTCLIHVIALLNPGTHACPFPDGTGSFASTYSEGIDESCVLVIENGQLVGVITLRDLVQIVAERSPLENLPVAEVMTQPVITLKQSELRDGFKMLNLFECHGIRHLPIVNDDNQVVGVVTPESLHHAMPSMELLKRRRVADVMTPEIINITPTNSVLTVAQRIAEHGVNYVVICEQQENSHTEPSPLSKSVDSRPFFVPLGIITERDIIQFQALELDLNLPAYTLMSFPLLCVNPEESLWTAHQKMQQWRVQQLGVCSHQGELLGMVTQTSILQTLDSAQLYHFIQDLQQQLHQQRQIISSLHAENWHLRQNRDEGAGEAGRAGEAGGAGGAGEAGGAGGAGKIWDQVTPMELRECQQTQGILQTLNRILKTLSESHRILMSATQESELFQKICRLIVEVGAYQGAWVGLTTDDMCQTVQPVAGFEALKKAEDRKDQTEEFELNNSENKQYLERFVMPEFNPFSGESPVDSVLQTGQPIVCRHIQTDPKFTPWRSHALQQGYGALIVLPLQVKDQPLGVLTIYAVNSGSFAPEEVQLLKELANDLASGIEGLRTRLAREQAEAELCQLNQELESRVQQRTAQLQQEIQEREGIEASLQQEFDLLSRVMETSPVGIIWVNPQGQIMLINHQAEQILGLKSEKICPDYQDKLTWYNQDESGDLIKYKQLPFWHLVKTNQAVNNLHYTIERDDGRRVLLSINGTSLFNQTGQLKGVVFAIDNVTERVKAEEELRQSEERFRTVANFTYDWEYWLNPDGQFLYVSPSCERITGYCADDFIQNASLLESIIYPEDREKFVRHGCATAVTQRVSGIDFRILTKTGELRWISHICQSVHSAEGRWLGIRASNRDITERKQAEEALRESEKRFRSMFNQVAVGIVQATLSGQFLWFNQKFTDLVQYSAEELQKKTCKDITHPDDVDQELTCLNQLLAGEIDTFSREKRYIRKDGSEVWVNLSGSLIRNSQGEPKSYIAVVQDISDRKQAQATLQRLNQQLTGRVNELGSRNREMVLLGDLSDFLQACLTVDEAYQAIATLVAPLFPGSSGGVFVINPSENWVEAMATWGTALASQTLFSPKSCWALRRGRPHLVTQPQSGLRCPHIHSDSSPLESFCVPMMAQGKALGILYISSPQLGQLTEAKQRLALTVAEHLALSLANLKLRETLSQQSIRDALTGLFNRRYMEESLEREIHRAQRHQRPMGIIMLDIDHFKHFNDTFGHEAGDAVLRELGIFLQRSIRASDIACRYGGEELMLILPDASLADTKQRAEQIRHDVKGLQIEYHHKLLDAIAISVGVAAFAEHGSTAQELIAAADRALYQAKAQGRDRVVTASS